MDSILKKLENIGVSKESSPKEIKRIRVLNITTYVALIHALFFLYFDFYQGGAGVLKLTTLFLEIIFFSLILYFQHKGYSKFARHLFTFTVYANLYFHCNYAFRGYYGEYQYLVIPLFSLFFFDNKYIHYGLLVLALVSFYVPNYYYDIYPDQYFGYLNVLFLFIGIFLIINYFKRTNEKNELRLSDQLQKNEAMKITLDQKNKELVSLNNFQNHFFVNIAHEMGTPVTLIKGQINLISKRFSKPEKSYPEFEKIVKQTDKLEHLLYNIMDIAKLDAKTLTLTKSTISINQIAQKAFLEFQPLLQEKQIDFKISLCPETLCVAADTIYLERTLSNILSNASKYTPTGGNISIRVESSPHTATLIITDTGIGVPPDELEAIFERFYQSSNHINKASGSGIGLAFVREIIKLHDGTVTAKNNLPSGLEITVTLPRDVCPPPLAVDLEIQNKQPDFDVTQRRHILIVEDNPEMRAYLTNILNQEYKTTEAQNGEEALQLLKNIMFDAIVTDYMMPIMDGELFIKNLKREHYKIPTIMITARQDIKSRLTILRLGVDDYLNKPFLEEELLLRLKNCIKNYTSAKTFSKKNELPQNDTNSTKFLEQAKELILENLNNSYFGVAQLSEHLRISERTLHRNIKKETGLSPNKFIREYKLTHVRQKVEDKDYTSLQELAASVGLSNGTYLNQLYKERFGTYIELP